MSARSRPENGPDRHSRESGNPVLSQSSLDARLRGHDELGALVAPYGAHVHLAHISPNLASPEDEGFQTSPKESLRHARRRDRTSAQAGTRAIPGIPERL